MTEKQEMQRYAKSCRAMAVDFQQQLETGDFDLPDSMSNFAKRTFARAQVAAYAVKAVIYDTACDEAVTPIAA